MTRHQPLLSSCRKTMQRWYTREIWKVKMGLALQLVKELRPLSTQAYSLRPTYEFKLENVKKVHDGTKFLSLLDPKIWELLPLEIKYPHSLEKVKMKNKSWISENFPYMLCKTYLYHIDFIKKYFFTISFQRSHIILLQIPSTIMEMIKMIMFSSIIPKAYLLLLLSLSIMMGLLNNILRVGNIVILLFLYCRLFI